MRSSASAGPLSSGADEILSQILLTKQPPNTKQEASALWAWPSPPMRRDPSPRGTPDVVQARASIAEQMSHGIFEARSEAAHYQGNLALAQRRLRRLVPELERLRRVAASKTPPDVSETLRLTRELADERAAQIAEFERRLASTTDELDDERKRHAAHVAELHDARRDAAGLRLTIKVAVAKRRQRLLAAERDELRTELTETRAHEVKLEGALRGLRDAMLTKDAELEAAVRQRDEAVALHEAAVGENELAAAAAARTLQRLRAGFKFSVALGLHATTQALQARHRGRNGELSPRSPLPNHLRELLANAAEEVAAATATAREAEERARKAERVLDAERQMRKAMLVEHASETARLRAACKLIIGLGLSLEERPTPVPFANISDV